MSKNDFRITSGLFKALGSAFVVGVLGCLVAASSAAATPATCFQKNKGMETINEVLRLPEHQALTRDDMNLIERRLHEAPLTVNIKSEFLLGMLNQPHLLNAFDVAEIGGPRVAPDRVKMEQVMAYRHTMDGSFAFVTPEEGLTYGGVNYRGRAYGAAPLYGTNHLVLKQSVRQRATFTHTDSLQMFNHMKISEMTDPGDAYSVFRERMRDDDNLVGVLEYLKGETAQHVLESVVSILPRFNYPSGSDYIEIQIGERVRIPQDIEKIVINQDEIDYWLTGTRRDLLPAEIRNTDPNSVERRLYITEFNDRVTELGELGIELESYRFGVDPNPHELATRDLKYH